MYGNRCYGYFYRLTGNREKSNDLLSQLFVKLVEKIHSFKGGSFDGWIFTIASNIFRDQLRFQLRQKKLLEDKAEQIRAEKPTTRAESEVVDMLQIALGKLDAETAELLVKRFYGELSFKELAELRKEPIGTTLSKVHRGLKKLKEIMEKEK